MMLIVGVVLGGVIAWWSYRLGGTVAAVVATAAFALDPNFIAHAPLVKNDVSLTLAMLLLMIAVWRAGRRLTIANALGVCLLCGAALNIKFSALLLGPMVLILLVARALMPQPWVVVGRELRTRSARVLIALGMCMAAALVSYAAIWATYGFRYLPTPDPNVTLNTDLIVEFLRTNELVREHGEAGVRPEHVAVWRPGPFSAGVLWMERNRLLPQAWLNGLLYTQQSAVLRKTYLLGRFSMTGWWYYFPLTMLFKSPLALIAAAAGAVVLSAIALQRGATSMWREYGWTITAFTVPVVVYMASAMTSNLNLGIRHVLPIYPFVFIAIGVAAARLWRVRPRLVKLAGAALVAALGVETLVAFPNYVAFFNVAAGGSRNGINLLGDSNLDWGQDLKLLAQWQQDHPGIPLYLCYFGMADPAYFGIDYKNLRGGYFMGPPFEPPRPDGVVAVSATHLQGIYLEADLRRLYVGMWQNLQPIEVLGGTIYLYRGSDVIDLAVRQRASDTRR